MSQIKSFFSSIAIHSSHCTYSKANNVVLWSRQSPNALAPRSPILFFQILLRLETNVNSTTTIRTCSNTNGCASLHLRQHSKRCIGKQRISQSTRAFNSNTVARQASRCYSMQITETLQRPQNGIITSGW